MLLISNSEISVFKTCKRKWYTQYYLERQPPAGDVKPVGATWLGTRMHAALEAYYSPAIDTVTSAASTAAVLLSIYKMDIEQWPEYSEELLEEYDMSRTMLEGYFEWLEETGADSQLEVISTEREFIVPFTDEVAIRGRLDMVVQDRSTGAKLFMDHKNVLNFLEEDYLDRDEQAKFYMMLQRLDKSSQGTRVDGGIFNQLRKVKRGPRAKPPFYKRTIVRHNPATLNSMYRRTFQVVNEIADLRATLNAGDADHAQVAYPHPTKDCAWMCPLASGLCMMMDDGSDWRDYIENEWVHVDPYARYTEDGYLDKLEQRGLL